MKRRAATEAEKAQAWGMCDSCGEKTPFVAFAPWLKPHPPLGMTSVEAIERCPVACVPCTKKHRDGALKAAGSGNVL